MAAISELFSLLGSPKSKLLILHASAECSGSVPGVIRSLISEHVHSEALLRAESARATPLGAALRRCSKNRTPPDDATVLSVMRRWFFARSAELGFALEGFPSTRLQALAFDDWLDARGTSLDQALWLSEQAPSGPVADYYRETGLLVALPPSTPLPA